MRHKYKLKIFIFAIVLCTVLLLLRPIYRRTLDIKIHPTDFNKYVYCFDDTYYYLQPDGIYVFDDSNQNKIIELNNCKQFVVDSQYIYCLITDSYKYNITIYDKNNSNKIKKIDLTDKNINLLGISDDKLIYCHWNNDSSKKNMVFLDISDGKKIDIENDIKNYGHVSIYKNDYIKTANIYSEDLFSTQNGNKINCNDGWSSTVIGFINNTIIYTCNMDFIAEIILLDTENNIENSIHIAYDSKLCGAESLLFNINEEQNKFVLAGNKASPFFLEAYIDSSDELKYHKYDVVAVFDSTHCSLINEKTFRTFERVICVDKDKVMTYYKGHYLTYDLNNWKVIRKQDADEIKNGGSYTFETCGDYIFVFDDDSGELLNTININ